VKVRIRREAAAGLMLLAAAIGCVPIGSSRHSQRTSPPPPLSVQGSPPLPSVVSRQLRSTAPLYLVRTHGPPLVTVRVEFLLSTGMSDAARAGARILPCVLRAGTLARNAAAMEDAYADLGGRREFTVEDDEVAGKVTGPVVNLGSLVALLAEEMFRAAVAAPDVARCREQIVGDLEQASGSAEAIAAAVFAQSVYGPRHPYASSASVDPVYFREIGDSALATAVKTVLDTAPLTVVVAGNVDLSQAAEVADAAFGARPVHRLLDDASTQPIPSMPTAIYFVSLPGASQARIVIGRREFSYGSEYRAVARVLYTAAGYSYGSRLNQALRVERGYTYGVWWYADAHRFVGDTRIEGFFDTAHTADCIRVVVDTMHLLAAAGLSRQEIVDSSVVVRQRTLSWYETTDGLAEETSKLLRYALPADYLVRSFADLFAVDRAGIKNMLARYSDDPFVVVVVADPAVLSQLRTLNLPIFQFDNLGHPLPLPPA
jgi:zinc protease